MAIYKVSAEESSKATAKFLRDLADKVEKERVLNSELKLTNEICRLADGFVADLKPTGRQRIILEITWEQMHSDYVEWSTQKKFKGQLSEFIFHD